MTEESNLNRLLGLALLVPMGIFFCAILTKTSGPVQGVGVLVSLACMGLAVRIALTGRRPMTYRERWLHAEEELRKKGK